MAIDIPEAEIWKKMRHFEIPVTATKIKTGHALVVKMAVVESPQADIGGKVRHLRAVVTAGNTTGSALVASVKNILALMRIE